MNAIATPSELIVRFCALREEVAAHMRYAHAADCVCGTGGSWPEGFTPAHVLANPPPKSWRDDGAVMDFIEKAVRAAITGTPVQQDVRSELEQLRDSITSILERTKP